MFSSSFKRHSSLIALLCLAACGLFSVGTDARYIKRNAENNRVTCLGMTPCAWEVYSPKDRTIEYYVESPCTCPSGKVCVRVSDDISVSAYVHLCRNSEEVKR